MVAPNNSLTIRPEMARMPSLRFYLPPELNQFAAELDRRLLEVCPKIGETHALATRNSATSTRFCLGEPMSVKDSQVFAIGDVLMLNEIECSHTGTIGFLSISLRESEIDPQYFKSPGGKCITIATMAIEPDYRAERIASIALTAATEIAAELGLPILLRNVKSEQIQARGLHLGYNSVFTRNQIHLLREPTPIVPVNDAASIYDSAFKHIRATAKVRFGNS